MIGQVCCVDKATELNTSFTIVVAGLHGDVKRAAKLEVHMYTHRLAQLLVIVLRRRAISSVMVDFSHDSYYAYASHILPRLKAPSPLRLRRSCLSAQF